MIGKIESDVERGGRVEHEKLYDMASTKLNPEMSGQAVCGHWGIENRLHWALDKVFREDPVWLRRGNARASMQSSAHRARPPGQGRRTTSFKNRRKHVVWNVDYVEAILRHTA
jgi:hypothetical protein